MNNNNLYKVIISVLLPIALLAQINWTEHTIDGEIDSPRSVYAIDLDGDGDVDILGASGPDADIGTIIWYENDDGDTTWTKHIIDGDFDRAISVYAVDMDGDSDVDVLGAAMAADDVVWYENDDGDTTWTKHIIDENCDGAIFVSAIDLDGDSDMDILGTAYSADDIVWYENDDGDTTWTKHLIDGLFDGANTVFAIDLDGDSDMDIVGSARNADDVVWYENDDGDTTWTKHIIDGGCDGAYSAYALDLDGDTDIDVIGTADTGDDIVWYENDDGDTTWTKHIIDANLDYPKSVFAIDLDEDDDIDVLGAAISANDIVWYENDDGDTTWTKHIIDGTFIGAYCVYATDIDDDGDIDILGAAMSADDITWWESDLASHDVGTDSIDIPSSVPEGTELSPQAIVKNYGTQTETFDVTCEIIPSTPQYNSIVTVAGLEPNNTTTVIFPDLFNFETGSYIVTVYTQLSGDDSTANDTLVKIISTYVIDVGVDSIDMPSSVPEGTELNPSAIVKNYGATTETFEITCEIDPGEYASTETISDLASGNTIQVTFPDTFLFESGSYTVTIYTQLEDDANANNDTLEKVIETYQGVTEGNSEIPETFSFNVPTINKSKSEIMLSLPVGTKVDLLVYDVIGRLSETLISARFSAGNHNIPIDLNLPAGVYFYNLKTKSGENIIKKFLIIE